MRSCLLSRFCYLLFLFILGDSFTFAMEEQGEQYQEVLHKDSITQDQLISLNLDEINNNLEIDFSTVLEAFESYLRQPINLKTLISFSQVNHVYRELLYRPKLQLFLDAPAYTSHVQENAYFLAKTLKKIALDERFLYGEVYAENSLDLRPTDEERQRYETKNNQIILDILSASKFMHFSPTFRMSNGPQYRDEIALRRGQILKLGVIQEVKSIFTSTRRDPVIYSVCSFVLLASSMAIFYDIYANYYQLNYRYGSYADHNNCIVYYAKAPFSYFGISYEKRTIPLCPQNTYEEKVFKTDESVLINGQMMKDQVMCNLLKNDVIFCILLSQAFIMFFRFFGF